MSESLHPAGNTLIPWNVAVLAEALVFDVTARPASAEEPMLRLWELPICVQVEPVVE